MKNYQFAVVRTAFHGGGIVSRHLTLSNAEKALKRKVGETDCTCGCAGIVPITRQAREVMRKDGYPDSDDTCRIKLLSELVEYEPGIQYYKLCV